MDDALLRKTPRAVQAFTDGGIVDDGERVAIITFAGRGAGVLLASCGGLRGIGLEVTFVGWEVVFAAVVCGGSWLFFYREPAVWSRGDGSQGSFYTFFFKTLVGDHGDLFAGNLGCFLKGDTGFSRLVRDGGFVLDGLCRNRRADHGLLGGGSNGLFDGAPTLLHWGEVGNVDKPRAVVGNNGHSNGDFDCCVGFGFSFIRGEVVDGFFSCKNTC